MRLTEEYVRSLTYPDYFTRGVEYWRKGKVFDLRWVGDSVEAWVRGTEDYTVKIDLSTLDFECNCMAFSPKAVCKHVVAVLLALIRGESGQKGVAGETKKKKAEFKPDVRETSGKGDVEEVWGKLRTGLKRLGRAFDRDWDEYVNCQDELYGEVSKLVGELPDNINTARGLLETAAWMDKHVLGRFDDSDGILQDMQYAVMAGAVRFLEKSQDVGDLEICWKYTKPKYDFESGADFVRAIFAEVNNPYIVERVGLKVERAMGQSDPDFGFDPAWVLADWCAYLQKSDKKRFEEVCLKFSGEVRILEMLLKSWLEEAKYDQIVDLAWNRREDSMIGEVMEQALIKLKGTDKLISYYSERLEDRGGVEVWKKLKRVCIEGGREEVWRDLAEKKLLKMRGSEAVELSMVMKNYKRAAEALIGAGDLLILPDQFEKFAGKLAVLDAEAGVKIYRYLLERELKKMAVSNYYDRLFAYLGRLKDLGDEKWIQEEVEKIREDFPTKRRLMERLDLDFSYII